VKIALSEPSFNGRSEFNPYSLAEGLRLLPQRGLWAKWAADLLPQRGRVQSQIKAESDDDKPYHNGNPHFHSECLFLRLTFLLPGLPSLMKIAALVH
jgi:hypothetical protein